MRVIVFSDTHGNLAAADHIFQANKLCDHFIFLGDGLDEMNVIKVKYPDKHFYCVSGNCDHGDTPTSQIIEIFGHRMFLTHGHLFNVRATLDELIDAAHKEHVEFILFGHTHCRFYKQENGLYIINPGSAAQPKDGLPAGYVFIELTPCGVSCAHVDL